MFRYTIELKTPTATAWSPLKSWARPFTDGTTLDDTLDEGCINLSCTTRSEPIPPFSKIRITIFESDSNGTYQQVGQIIRVVGTSKRTRRTFAPSSSTLWDWSIQTLEETKQLEREACRTMTSTNYLDYQNDKKVVYPAYTEGFDSRISGYGNKQVYYAPFLDGQPLLIIPAISMFKFEEAIPACTVRVASPSGQISTFEGVSFTGFVPTDKPGIYIISYAFDYGENPVSTAIFRIEVVNAIKGAQTITSICERLLSAGITRRQGIDEQKYTLDPVFAEKYANVPAPEFSFTNQTLFEALLAVGGYIHAIPRLNGNVVTFDELGGDDEIDMTNFPKQVYCDKTITINDFTSTLDSPSQNLLNTQDRVRGAITELGNDYITVRTEDSEIIIDEDHAIIHTSLPINQIVKLECGYVDGLDDPVGDITYFVYESADYDILSSYSGYNYPYSKGFALRYSQGDNKITGLQTKITYPFSSITAFNNPAIVNIIQAKTGKVIGINQISRLAFRVTYVPIVTSRVTQRKPYGNENGANNGADWENTLFYNQGGNVVESSFYGDKMKGAIARLGNEVEQRTYDFYHYSQLPKCGQKLDGMYIARVDAEYDITRIRATLTLTKDFNMLSQYVGLNSNYRLYDISEKQSVESCINYKENAFFGDLRGQQGAQSPLIAEFVTNSIIATLSHDSEKQVSVALIDSNDKDGNSIGNKIVLPVVSFGFGNSIAFAFSMRDNYGAGFQNSGKFENDNKGVQRLVPYSDKLGELETMYVNMYTQGWTPDKSAQQKDGYADKYPEYIDGSITAAPIISTGINPFIVKKDSREALSLSYQVHFIANRPTIVLGPSLAYSNALVATPKSTKFNLYYFDHNLNMLDKVIDLTGAQMFVSDGVVSQNAGETNFGPYVIVLKSLLAITNAPANKDYKAWGIVEVENNGATKGSLFIGENIEIAQGTTPTKAIGIFMGKQS